MCSGETNENVFKFNLRDKTQYVVRFVDDGRFEDDLVSVLKFSINSQFVIKCKNGKKKSYSTFFFFFFL